MKDSKFVNKIIIIFFLLFIFVSLIISFMYNFLGDNFSTGNIIIIQNNPEQFQDSSEKINKERIFIGAFFSLITLIAVLGIILKKFIFDNYPA